MSESQLEQLDYQIQGMTCSSCVNRVQKQAEKIPGVKSAQVNLTSETLKLEVEPGFSSEQLQESISSIGYGAIPKTDKAALQKENQKFFGLHLEEWGLIASALLTLPLVLPMIIEAAGGRDYSLPGIWQLILATPVQFIFGYRFYRAGFSALKSGSFNMDILVAIGSSAAYGLSVYQLIADLHHAHFYFESAAVIITLVRLGKYMEGRAKRKTGEALRELEALLPEEVTVVRKSGDEVLSLSRVKRGDRLRIRPGFRIPLDGRLLEGSALVDEAIMTGESRPIEKRVGDKVLGGTMNMDGQLIIEVTALSRDGRLGQMISFMEEAQGWKAPIQKLVDRVTSVFVPFVLVLAALTFLGWGFWTGDWEQAILNAVATLVIACPCALGLATPTSIMAGTGAAAKAGILINEAEALEMASQVRHIVFDKTGTLTEGKPELTDFKVLSSLGAGKIEAWILALQMGSGHPLAAAVRENFVARGVAPSSGILNFKDSPGRGVSAEFEGLTVAIGSERTLREEFVPLEAVSVLTSDLKKTGKTISFVYSKSSKEILAVMAFKDKVKADAKAAIAELKSRGLKVSLLSGDLKESAENLAREIGIESVFAEVLPEEKAKKIKELEAHERVAMVGDGVNDAPALAVASLSMAMSTGADVAIHSSSMTLLGGNPLLVPAALDISERTFAKMKQNLFWAFIYNVVALPLAILGFLNPMIAGTAMALSSVSVVLNALTLSRKNLKPKKTVVTAAVLVALFGLNLPSRVEAAPKIPNQENTKVVKYKLTATQGKVNLSGKQEVDFALMLNGSIPAPVLEFTEGDIAEIEVINQIPGQELSIHWHGLLLPPLMDGVPYVTTPPIHSGESFTFRFPLRQNGTYWYHSHTNVQEQKGLYGAFIIHPKKQSLKFAKDIPIVLSDWTDENPTQVLKNLRKDGEYYLYKKNSIRSWWGAIQEGKLGNLLANEWMRMGGMDLSDVGYDAFLANGKKRFDISDVKAGDLVRLRLINAAASSYLIVNWAGGDFEVVAVDGIDITPRKTSQITMGMAETYDIVVKIPTDGSFELRSTIQDVTGYASVFLGKGEDKKAPDIPRPDDYALMDHGSHGGGHAGHGDHHGHADHSGHGDHHDHHGHHNHAPQPAAPLKFDDIRSPVKTTFDPKFKRHEVKLVLGGDMERYVWHINGKAIHEDRNIIIKENDVVIFTLVNETMMHHPMHLHGHFFRAVNGQGDYSPLKHTVDVPPFETRTIEFLANEPGEWMLHCHNLYHLKTGMARVVKYSDFTPSPDIAKLQEHDPHLHDHIYSTARVDASPKWVSAKVKVSKFWDELHLRAEGARTDKDHSDKWQREIDFHYKRFVDQYFHWVIGVSDFHDEQRLEAGAGLLLPLLVESRLVVDSKAKLRLDLEKRFQWTRTVFSDLEVRLRDSEKTEVEWSLMYSPSWSWAAGFRGKNDYADIGVMFRF